MVAQEGVRPSQRPTAPEPSVWQVNARLIAWTRALIRYGAWLAMDVASRRRSPRRTGERLRRMLERMGGTAVKVGLQLSTRIDLLPYPTCLELSRLRDAMPPFPIEQAIARVEAAIGGPLDTVFEAFDPTPIVSDSMACIYQARLLDGQMVAVKVRRPGIRRWFKADTIAMGVLLQVLEALTIVRPGLYQGLRGELDDMVMAELDFAQSARFHRLFRKRLRRARIDWASAAVVHDALSSSDVMVSGFVSGVWLDELLAVVEEGDAAARARLQGMGIDPERVARRLLQLSWWGFFENLFFVGEPRPTAIVVEPGDRLVFVAMGDCGHTAEKNRRLQRDAIERLLADDVSGAVDAMVQSVTPLPRIDLDDFSTRVEAKVWPLLFALRDPGSGAEERIVSRMWVSLVEVASQMGVRVRLSAVQMIRASLMYDTLAGRLDPDIRPLKEFERYLRKAELRSARRVQKALERRSERGLRAPVLANMEEAGDSLRRLRFWVETVVRELPVQFLSFSNKGAYAAEVLLTFVTHGALVAALAGMVAVAHARVTGTAEAAEAFRVGVTHPATVVLLVFMAVTSARRLLFRLSDKDPDD